jgi:large subunit ribosomal protein L9
MARSIQVVLTEDLPNVGKSGDLVRVRPGFARNFLVPRGLAAMATRDNVARVEHEKRVALARAVKVRKAAEELATKMSGCRLAISAQVGEEDKLYGSITSRDIEEALAGRGFVVDRRKIVMDPIKELGSHKVNVKIASGVEAAVTVDVLAKVKRD